MSCSLSSIPASFRSLWGKPSLSYGTVKAFSSLDFNTFHINLTTYHITWLQGIYLNDFTISFLPLLRLFTIKVGRLKCRDSLASIANMLWLYYLSLSESTPICRSQSSRPHAYLEAIEPAYRFVSLAINKNATVEVEVGAVARAMRNLWPFVSMTLSWKEISYAKAQEKAKGNR